MTQHQNLRRYNRLERTVVDMLQAGRDGQYVHSCVEEIIDAWYSDEGCDCGYPVMLSSGDDPVWRCSRCLGRIRDVAAST